MKRIVLGAAVAALALSTVPAYALCPTIRCVGSTSVSVRKICPEGEDCDRYCVLTDSTRIVCTP